MPRRLVRSIEAGALPRRTLLLAAVGLILAALGLAGCAPYRFGTATLYPANIRTVYVPIFESDSYRRNLGEAITEALIKEIQAKTPYKVVSTPAADSVLTGRLINETKTIVVESPTDEGRLNELNFLVEVQWIDRRGGVIREMPTVAVPEALVSINQSSRFVSEVGSTYATARDKAFKDLAEQIVNLMETPW